MDHVYSARIGMSQQNPEIESQPPFFSGLGPSSLQLESSPISPRSDVKEAGYLKVAQFSVVLTIFTVEVNVDTGEKLSAELHRSMRKNPPRTLKCELVYVRNPAMPLVRDADVPSRRGRRTIMQARKRMKLSPKQPVVSSKVCVRI